MKKLIRLNPSGGAVARTFILGFALLGAAQAFAQFYQVTDLGTLGGPTSEAFGINSSGQVVGSADIGSGATHAFLYSGGMMTDLGTLGGANSAAFGINDSGQIVGRAGDSAKTADFHAFLYSNGSMTDSGPTGYEYSFASSINNSGHAVGYFEGGPGNARAALYAAGTVNDLGTFGGAQAVAIAINANGEIAGQVLGYDGSALAYDFQNGTVTLIGSLGAKTGSRAYSDALETALNAFKMAFEGRLSAGRE